ncbi:hypothetical protein [Robbsia sp. KACC 23696]|uniref:hypothetical protein n=1 Tax=Robbsia sp. KACC 23696 TaxID=3149231 RepID=UPI00325BB826
MHLIPTVAYRIGGMIDSEDGVAYKGGLSFPGWIGLASRKPLRTRFDTVRFGKRSDSGTPEGVQCAESVHAVADLPWFYGWGTVKLTQYPLKEGL